MVRLFCYNVSRGENMTYLEELNEDQLKAVQTTEGYLRVIAGAGSGKTKLLVSRYVYLVSEYGINPANVLCVTFTNKAANEMKKRVKVLLGDDFDSSLITTYHGFCARVLREDCDKIFYPKSFQIMDTDAQKDVLDEIYQQFELKLDHASFEKIIKKISQIKGDQNYVSCMCTSDKCQILPQINAQDDEIIEEYLQKQKKSFTLDFQDLINFTLYLFKKNSEVKEKWQDKLNYIQVDEFQDSSSKEMQLVDILSYKYKNLMIVGDPDQNIYEWRGSNVKLLVDFDQTHENCQTQFLTRNYRSTSKILRCANTLIDYNEYRLKKELYTENGEGEDVIYYHEKNEYDEAARVIEQIEKMKNEQNCLYSNFAVLYRSSFLSWSIEKKLNERGIPYEIFGGIKFYQRMEIQDVIAYLRLICFDDNTAFKRIVNKPRRRFGKVKMQRLLALKAENDSLFETLCKNVKDDTIKRSEASAFVKLILDMRQKILIDGIADVVSSVCVESGYESYIRELGDMERFDNLTEFKRITREQEQAEGEPLSMDEFLGRIAIQMSDSDKPNKDTVKLMTVHASKGLEFPVVFMIGMSESVFPNAKAIEERGKLGLEEERRLCYVAITRARKRLFLLESEGFTPRGAKKTPSRFLREIGKENYTQIGVLPEDFNEERSLHNKQQTDNDLPNLKIGDTISHPAFGDGVIQKVSENGTSYQIKFQKDGKERDISALFFGKNPLKPIERTRDTPTRETEKPIPCIQEQKPKESNFLFGVRPEKKETKRQERVSGNGKGLIQSIKISENFSETGWRCVGITDMGSPCAKCQLCERQIVRYVHHMESKNGERLDVGCVCAGKLEGNLEKAKEREKDFKNKQSRQVAFTQTKLSKSRNGNLYLKINGHVLVLLEDKYHSNCWRYAIDGDFSKYAYMTIEDALADAFKDLEGIDGAGLVPFSGQ